MYRHRNLMIRVQLALYRYCGTCATMDRTHLIWKHCLKCLTKFLIWPQRNTTGLPDIKRSNPWNRASHSRNTEILYLLSVLLIFLNLATICTHALSTQWIKVLAFWKHQLACSSVISTSIYSQKSVIHQVFTYGREREMLCVYELSP